MGNIEFGYMTRSQYTRTEDMSRGAWLRSPRCRGEGGDYAANHSAQGKPRKRDHCGRAGRATGGSPGTQRGGSRVVAQCADPGSAEAE